MRCFIGVDFSRELKNQIASLQSKLRTISASGRWKYIDNFHLTLKFLDEIDLKQKSVIEKELQDLCAITPSFTLKVAHLGNFPGKDDYRVLWLSLGGELDSLRSLQRNIDTRLKSVGFSIEKRQYVPHITIGQNLVFGQAFEEIKKLAEEIIFSDILVDRIFLFKSEQAANKRVYTPISEFGLR
ncbi:MAG: RNA 2',3'-cyclic phosphodiesterase [Clostridia bacterium]|nr:RNA 2',3'-cyclic phosphodiesterase [Clostridia bacterium]